MSDAKAVNQEEALQECAAWIEIIDSGQIGLVRKRMATFLAKLKAFSFLVNIETFEWIVEAQEILASGRVSLAREHLKNLVAYANLPPPRFPDDPHFTPRNSHVR